MITWKIYYGKVLYAHIVLEDEEFKVESLSALARQDNFKRQMKQPKHNVLDPRDLDLITVKVDPKKPLETELWFSKWVQEQRIDGRKTMEVKSEGLDWESELEPTPESDPDGDIIIVN